MKNGQLTNHSLELDLALEIRIKFIFECASYIINIKQGKQNRFEAYYVL